MASRSKTSALLLVCFLGLLITGYAVRKRPPLVTAHAHGASKLAVLVQQQRLGWRLLARGGPSSASTLSTQHAWHSVVEVRGSDAWFKFVIHLCSTNLWWFRFMVQGTMCAR